jgi:hypothetical protein
MSDIFGPPVLPPSPFGNSPLIRRVPVGGILVGGIFVFPDLVGNLHRSAADALEANNGMEGDFSRGATGACPQNPDSLRKPPG